jgi:hypothetical protein
MLPRKAIPLIHLSLDVGQHTTRAFLFAQQDGRYSLLGTGSSRSSRLPPHNDILPGVYTAIADLQRSASWALFAADGSLIRPVQASGRGVESISAAFSGGTALRTLVVGLSADHSLAAALRLVRSLPSGELLAAGVEAAGDPAGLIDRILCFRPELIIAAGGSDGGARGNVLALLQAVGRACRLLPDGERPLALFAGNAWLQPAVERLLGEATRLSLAPNIAPEPGRLVLEPATHRLNTLLKQAHLRNTPGLSELNRLARGQLYPAAFARGRLLRYLSKLHPKRGVLSVDLGASGLHVVAAQDGELFSGVYPDLVPGSSLPDDAGCIDGRNASGFSTDALLPWLSAEVSPTELQAAILNQALYPGTLPATYLAQAIYRAQVRHALAAGFQRLSSAAGGESLPEWYEPVLAGGTALVEAPTLAHACLQLLDGLQPAGVTTLVLDRRQMLAALGAAAGSHPALAVMLLDSPDFQHLATVIAPRGEVPLRQPALKVTLKRENQLDFVLEVRQGTLEVIPLKPGEKATLHLQPYHLVDVGMGGPGVGGQVRLVGGALGVVIDCRGRPLRLPEDRQRRGELEQRWLGQLGGEQPEKAAG